MRRHLTTAIALTVILAACGSSSDDTPATDAPATDPPVTEPAVTEPAATDPPATEPPATDPPPVETELPVETITPPEDDESSTEGAEAGPVAVSLIEFSVLVDEELPAGPTTFEVVNDGNFPHEFGITEGTSYADLPQLDNGAIDEEALGDALVGISDILQSGDSATVEFDLAPGTYVFFCNISVGPNSHAAEGQTRTVIVTG